MQRATFSGEPVRFARRRCASRTPGPLRVLRVLCTRRLIASRLGYSVDSRQGPTLVRRVIRIWQRHDRMVDVDDLVGLDTRVGDLRVRLGATLRHPYDDA